jgi:hypothetical protein
MNEPTDLAQVPRAAFAFCRYTVAAMLWAAWLLRCRPLVAAVWALLFLSWALTIRRAPLVVLYTWTVERIRPSAPVALSLGGMRFAHGLGATLGLICVALVYSPWPRAGWAVTLIFCALKTVSAVGLCPAYKLHDCMARGTCCAFLKRQRP